MSTETKDFGMGPVTIPTDKEYTPDPMSAEMLPDNGVFVFGSNTLGHHGGGAARFAHQQLGAEWGVGEGLTGRTYALPTLNFGMTQAAREGGESPLMTYDQLLQSFKNFVEVAKTNPAKKFYLTKVGLGIAGYPLETIHKAFWESGAPFELTNLVYPVEFELPDDAQG
jgi:hypothetical protein